MTSANAVRGVAAVRLAEYPQASYVADSDLPAGRRRVALCPYALYEMVVRTNLKPALGTYPLTRLSAARVQAFFNGELAAGQSIRRVQIMRTVLSSALTRAMREELVVRNVARLAELPAWERKPITPWTGAEARAFLEAAKDDPLYPAFVLLLVYGLRRGEVLGLRWRDIDEEDGEIRIRQQIHRARGVLQLGQSRPLRGGAIYLCYRSQLTC
jgi:integrase